MNIRGLSVIFLIIVSVSLAITGMFVLIGTQSVYASLKVEQPVSPVSAHRIVIKLKDEPQRTITPDASGHESLDDLMSRFNVKTVSRLFNMERGNAQLKEQQGLSRVYVLSLPSTVNVETAISAFSADSNIEYAEADSVSFGSLFPNDNRFTEQWGLHNTGQNAGKVDADIDAPEAWDIATGVSSTIIAVIDSGVDLDHPDLAGKLVPGYDYVNDDYVPQDDHGHGTHVAGIAAATSNNITGTSGVCGQCSIMPLKALDRSITGYNTWVASAIEYAVDSGAHVINTSLGSVDDNQYYHDAVIYAYKAGVPIVAAMMNDGDSTLYYPAAYTETIAVGSTDRYDDRSSFSNFGNHIDLVAPGSRILSTMWDDTYHSVSGTSMAAPHVAAVLGLIHSIDQGYTVEELRGILRTTAEDQIGPPGEDSPGWDNYFGSGRLNAAQALNYIVPVQANFNASTNNGIAPLPVVFTNTSSGNYSDSLWHFGDGITSTQSSPSHTYTIPGVYTVALTVEGSNGTDETVRTNYVTVYTPVQASFTSSANDGPAPLTVVFTNTSAGDYIDSLWAFGDGTTSTLDNPTYTYTVPGVYTITLTVSGTGGINTETKEAYIMVNEHKVHLPLVVRTP